MDFDSSALPYEDLILRDKRVWFCPNVECSFQRKLEQGKSCPECGDEAKEFDLLSMTELLRMKKERKKSRMRSIGPKRVQYERYGLVGVVLLLVGFLLLITWNIDEFLLPKSIKAWIMFACLILGTILLGVQFGRVTEDVDMYR